jgi:subfamily B ATP-binding cassette protein MsbA
MISLFRRLLGQFIGYATFARRCFGLLTEERGLFIALLVASLAAAITEGVGVSLLVPVLESFGSKPVFADVPLLGRISAPFMALPVDQRLQWAAGCILVVVLLRGMLQYAVAFLGFTIPFRLQRRLSLRAYDALLQVEIGYINRNQAGVLSNNVFALASRISVLLKNFGDLIWNALLLLLYLSLMLAISWRLTVTAFIFVAAVSVLLRKFTSGPIRAAGMRMTEAGQQLSQLGWETLGAMKLIRLAVAESRMARLCAERIDAVMAASWSHARIVSALNPLFTTLAGIFICVILFAATWSGALHEGQFIGVLLLFIFLLSRMLGPVSSMNVARANIQGEMHALDQLERFLAETRAARQPNGTRKLPRIETGLAFEGVDFAYAATDGPVLQDVSFVVPRGKMAAMVGPSGAGKSTIVSLAARLYDPGAGRVAVDGIDLRELDSANWRRRISVVSQDIVILNDSVANNIGFGRDDVSFERVREAARLAAAADFIEALPQGYDTMLGDRGVRLSGGQQQRIAIARAIITDPELLILDEATSHLDSVTERAIQRAVERLSRDRTILVIAHRLSTIRRADNIVVLSQGRIVEQGRHAQLLAARGEYWKMIELQRLDLIDDEAELAAEAAR